MKSEPRLLFRNGQFLEKAMNEERVRKDELLQAMRSKGVHSLGTIEAIVLETNGNFSIIKHSEGKENSILAIVRG